MPKLDLLIAKLDFYVVGPDCKSLFSFEVNNEGVFLFVAPIQFALLWPWVKV